MKNYLFLERLFKTVLSGSKTMQGRFHVCPRYGQEINTDLLESVIADVVKPVHGKQYPAVLMMPPSSGLSLNDTAEWQRYSIEMYFLNTSYYTGSNQVKAPNKNTQTSTQRIIDDWGEMHTCAKDFIMSLNLIEDSKTPDELLFRMASKEKKYFDPMSLQGNAKLSGVKLSFKCDIWTGCDVEDYDPDFWPELPSADTTLSFPFANQTNVIVSHVLAHKPIVQVMDETGALIGCDIVHTTGSFTVSFDSLTTGTIIFR
jgi:hypothetical protein